MQGSKRGPVPPPLRLDGSSLSSGELARLVSESIEDVALPEEEPPLPFSPSVVAKQLSRIGAEAMLAEDLRTELLTPEGRAQIPHPTALEEWEARIKDLALISKLAAQLWGYLGVGWRWYVSFWRLVLFAVLLLPGFAQMAAFYFFSPRMLRSIPYGVLPRNRLDVFLPRKEWRAAGPRPTVIFITGGAWTIGYKAWGALLGRRLSQRGVLVFCLDYRNFPQGNALDMLQDVNTGIAWVLRHAAAFGGDGESFHLVGQSAGGQLGALALMLQMQQSLTRQPQLGASPVWDPTRIRGFVGVSGAYNLYALADHLHRRGLYRNLFEAIHSLEGKPMLRELSPTFRIRKLGAAVGRRLPPMLILHGTADRSVPMEIAIEFVAALKEAGVPAARLKLYKGKTHTKPIVEDPMRGGRDELMDDVLSQVLGQQCHNLQMPMLPAALIDLASWVCPF
ncbi:putative isoprenylcysteine alpha-carbonyl methylesterase ICMEL1 [Chlorella sorokiniana]|uniref:protein-S-isoprenylcysteine alpha-carbonyl methylesterase n=1 Tax=Chlorella sorokiniana TaxID=3076 RepID=A0A2P6TLJ4_CHLSO|nr:putative isoprenylcysteine alpha-carbonyl methylesterase ICMEL1 [Chlorella sorokiniana]|eukprot:PRW45116.1 putative isoprenylcysteine alpha-carbonyl methylesterase ICMEL1 [Chlorella sorokiniana]